MELETKDTKETKKAKETKEVKTSKHAKRYIIVGILITAFNYGLYAIIANLIIKNNDYLWVSTLISTIATIFVAYFSHSKITWKERKITKTAIYKFFIWNFAIAFAIGPWITQLFNYLTPLYNLAYSICQNIHIDFSYDFIQSTGAFAFSSLVVMIINFLFYDKFVFGKEKE